MDRRRFSTSFGIGRSATARPWANMRPNGIGRCRATMHFSVRRLHVDNDEVEPHTTTADLEVVRNGRGDGPPRGLLSWALTVLTADEPWHHGLGECQLVMDVDSDRHFRGRAVLIRSDRGR